MKPRDQHKEPAATRPPPPRRRFSIGKLEERIAPKKGGTKSFYCFTDFHCTRGCG